ncbi:MAG: DNA polymerase III subunit gamma/tau [Nitrospirota bacterium]
MSYQVLARKWRPQVFGDVAGQGHITRTLQNAIAANRLAHAFLFSGPRGVGKTTTARILAKALNCAQGPTPTPCGACDSCLETTAGTSVDVIEIDGASNRGIEHIRELREAVKYAPVGGKYKVYVIDEVHMLTNEAFNALLKTLEEPPPHVIFIFATTEPQKVPATIHSRCQRYGFKRISLNEIIAKLREIAGKEGMTISDQGLGMIARAAEGSMRDAQSLLDQAVSYSGMTIKDEDLQTILGAVSQNILTRFTAGLLSRDTSGLLNQVDALLEQGQDMRQFLAGVVEHARNLIVTKIAADPGQIIELPDADIEAVKQQAAGTDMERLLMLFDSLSKTLEEMRWSPHQRFTLEVGLVKACSLAPLKPLGELLERMKTLEARLPAGVSRGTMPAADVVREKPASYSASKTPVQPQPPAPVGAGIAQGDSWSSVVAAVKAKRPSLASVLAHSRLLERTGDGLVIGITGTRFQMDLVEKNENRSIIEQIAAEALNAEVRIKFQLLAEDKKQGVKAAAPKKKTPAEHDPLVQDALKIFDGRVVETDEADI